MAILTRLRVLALSVSLGVSLSGVASQTAGQDTIEHEVRAAFVYNFTKFIDWPAEALPLDGFRVCVIGDPPFAAALDAMIAGEVVQGRPILRVEPETPAAVSDCQILYVGRQDAERGRRTLAAARKQPTLTIGDAPRFLEEGGAIKFLLEADRVRFDVNLPAVERAGLTMSSKLLRVARRVEETRR
jgi:hypothetical protein